MSQLPDFIKQVELPVYPYRYTICTLVTRKEEYREMLDSFIQAGFTTDICEYLIIDNSQSNIMDAYQGINSFLQKAQGEYIIICHQDILLIEESSLTVLEQRMAEMTALDPNWAILSNAGATDSLYQRMAIKIKYPSGVIDIKGTLPQKVASIDENFMLIKNSANLSISGDIKGYHFYGLDLCMVARLLGYSAYVIDFLLIHKSLGNPDHTFDELLKQMRAKYVNFLKGRYISTTIARFYLSGSAIKNMLFNTRVFRRVIKTAQEIKSKLSK